MISKPRTPPWIIWISDRFETCSRCYILKILLITGAEIRIRTDPVFRYCLAECQTHPGVPVKMSVDLIKQNVMKTCKLSSRLSEISNHLPVLTKCIPTSLLMGGWLAVFKRIKLLHFFNQGQFFLRFQLLFRRAKSCLSKKGGWSALSSTFYKCFPASKKTTSRHWPYK